MSTCPKYFCREHGATSTPPKQKPVARSPRACGWGLLAACLLAFGGFFVPGLDLYAVVGWSALGIAGFPLLSRAGARRTFAWALLAASMTPLALLLQIVSLRDAARAAALPPSVSELLLHIAPVYAAVGVAVVLAKLLEDLRSKASNAQQLGLYQLENKIGQGGMGEVWQARHALLSRPAAIKLIKPQRLADGSEVIDERAKVRFQREAQITASLQSPHTVELYDFGATSSGTFYYVMELLGGSNLEELVQREGPLEPERAVHILRQLLDSLAEAHDRGLVHRDIKPANIVVSRRGLHDDFVKVLDFGLVQPTESSPRAGGTLHGTPAYLAPETVTGSAPIDARTDLYAVGCVAYWLLTGTTVFAAKTPTQMAVAHALETPETPSERLGRALPWWLERTVMDCLAKDPANRPESALELLARLNAEGREQSGEYAALPLPAPRASASVVN